MRQLLGSSLSLRRRLCGAPFAITDANIVCVGSSLTHSAFGVYSYPAMMQAQLLAGGDILAATSNQGHDGWTINTGLPGGRLTSLIAADIQPLWNGAKQNILILEGTTNDMYLGATGAQAYQAVIDYVDLLQTIPGQRWKVVFVTPTPRNDVGTPVTFPADRAALLALIGIDPTFGGRVDAICNQGTDPRLQNTADTKYYQPDLVHYTEITNGIFSANVISSLRGLDPAFVMRPSYFPLPDPYLSADSGALNAGGLPAAEGERVATWQPVYQRTSGDFTQAVNGLRPIYRAAGLAGGPSLESDPNTNLDSANSFVAWTGYTFAARIDASAAGFVITQDSASVGLRLRAAEGPGDYTIYDITNVGPVASLKSAGAGTIIGQGAMVLVSSSDGTDVTHRLFKNGVLLATATFGGFNGNPTGSGATNMKAPSGGGGSFTGQYSRIFASPVPFTDTEMAELSIALAA